MSNSRQEVELRVTLILDPGNVETNPTLFKAKKQLYINFAQQAVYIGFAAFNVLFSSYYDLPLVVLQCTKSVQIVLLILFIFMNNKQRKFAFQNFVLLGFLFAGFGDFCLTTNSKNSFMIGLYSFIVTQLFYSFACLYNILNVRLSKFKYCIPTLVVIALMIAYIPASCLLFKSKTDTSHLIPIVIYVVILQIMVCLSLLRQYRTCALSFFLFSAGAILYSASDNSIAYQKFEHWQGKYENALILGISYLGLDLIYYGTLYHTQWVVDKYSISQTGDSKEKLIGSNIEIYK